MQGVAVRAAGFVIVPLAAVAPSVKVLYMITMYISVCTRYFPQFYLCTLSHFTYRSYCYERALDQRV